MSSTYATLSVFSGLLLLISLAIAIGNYPYLRPEFESVRTNFSSLSALCESFSETEKVDRVKSCDFSPTNRRDNRQYVFSEIPWLKSYVNQNRTSAALRSPSMSLEMDNGWLVSFDSGEWGGGLFWFDRNSMDREAIYYEECRYGNAHNVSHIFRWQDQVLALGGLDYDGYILLITKNSTSNKWVVLNENILPYDPRGFVIIDGRLFVELGGGENVVEITSLPTGKVQTRWSCQNFNYPSPG